jgi:hypothetical protein
MGDRELVALVAPPGPWQRTGQPLLPRSTGHTCLFPSPRRAAALRSTAPAAAIRAWGHPLRRARRTSLPRRALRCGHPIRAGASCVTGGEGVAWQKLAGRRNSDCRAPNWRVKNEASVSRESRGEGPAAASLHSGALGSRGLRATDGTQRGGQDTSKSTGRTCPRGSAGASSRSWTDCTAAPRRRAVRCARTCGRFPDRAQRAGAPGALGGACVLRSNDSHGQATLPHLSPAFTPTTHSSTTLPVVRHVRRGARTLRSLPRRVSAPNAPPLRKNPGRRQRCSRSDVLRELEALAAAGHQVYTRYAKVTAGQIAMPRPRACAGTSLCKTSKSRVQLHICAVPRRAVAALAS